MYTELFIDKGMEEPIPGIPLREQNEELRVASYDMSKNSQLSFRVKVKGVASPLKFRLDYFDTNLGQALNHKQLVQLRGAIDIFVSRSTDTPKEVMNQVQDANNNCEKLFQQVTPP